MPKALYKIAFVLVLIFKVGNYFNHDDFAAISSLKNTVTMNISPQLHEHLESRVFDLMIDIKFSFYTQR